MLYRNFVIGLLAILIWGIGPTFFKKESSIYPLSFLLMMRFAFSCIILSPVLFQIGKKLFYSKITWGILEIKIFLSLLISYSCLGIALKNLPATVYIVIYSLNPIFSLILLKTKLDLRLIFTVLLSVLGVFLILGNSQSVQASFISVLILFLGVVGWASYTCLLIQSNQIYQDAESSALAHLFSGGACVIWWILSQCPTAEVDLRFLWLSLVFGIVSPVAFFSFSYSLRRLPMMGLLGQYLEPVFGCLASALLLKEKFIFSQYVGAGIVLLGLWLSRKKITSSQA